MVRAASSSSPSVKHISPDHPVTIDSIRPHASVAAGVSVFAWYDPLRPPESPRPPRNKDRPRAQRVRKIRFDIDREIWNRAAGDNGWTEKVRVPFGELQELVEAGQRSFVVAAAVDLLARREHSEAELRRKLRRKGFHRGACDHALTVMADRGYQSDRRFAQAWLRQRMRGKGVSRRAALAALADKGVARELAQEVVSAYESEHPGCFLRALEAQLLAAGVLGEDGAVREGLSRDDRERITRRVLRRGFSYGELKEFFP